jgi:hypothetical protein
MALLQPGLEDDFAEASEANVTDAEATEPMPAPEEPPPVEIHKPKPVHNWREFLIELGTITLGVGIALAAEQAVEWVHWHNKVAEARAVSATELASSVGNAVERMMVERCGERRLDALEQILDGASRTGRLPPVGDIGQMPLRQWTSGAWDGVLASQTATHFPRQELANLAMIYGFVRKADTFAEPEVAAWTELSGMSGPGRRLDPVTEDRFRAALGHARYFNRTRAELGMVMIDRMKNQDIVFSKDDLAIIEAGKERVARPGNRALCGPIGPAMSSYGQGPMSTTPTRVDQALKTLPDFAKAAP